MLERSILSVCRCIPAGHQRRPLWAAPCSRSPSRRDLRCFATKTGGDGGDDGLGEGDLLGILRAEMKRKQEAADELQGIVDEEKQKLQELADEVKEVIDNTGKLNQDKANEGFDKAMESINALSSDLEKQLEKSKRQREEDEQEFYEWEEDMANAKNEGQFFKGLYQPYFKNKKKRGDQQQGNVVRPMRRRSKVGSWSTAIPRSETPLFRTFLIGLGEGVYLQKLVQDLNANNGAWAIDLGVMLLFLATWPFTIPPSDKSTS